MRIRDWSSDVCSSDLVQPDRARSPRGVRAGAGRHAAAVERCGDPGAVPQMRRDRAGRPLARRRQPDERRAGEARAVIAIRAARPEDAPAIAAIYATHVTRGTAPFEIEAPDSRAMRRPMASSARLYPGMGVPNGDADHRDRRDSSYTP